MHTKHAYQACIPTKHADQTEGRESRYKLTLGIGVGSTACSARREGDGHGKSVVYTCQGLCACSSNKPSPGFFAVPIDDQPRIGVPPLDSTVPFSLTEAQLGGEKIVLSREEVMVASNG